MGLSVRSPSRRGMISLFEIILLLFGAVFGSFVLGFGSSGSDATAPPQAMFEFESDGSGTVTITHTGGEMVPRSEIEVRSPGTVSEWPGEGITAGESITVSRLESGDTVQVLWESPASGAEVVLATYDVP
ncbi:type IV pilin N-terminal domain-containing protein [Halorhabdus amylolytica]|uniref:type IV pilin N-terminal domain-containing protein n=1 Tax=Halorhabdus amylolytica TaxID=2559573 RepID=UPI0010AA37F5|nr:type IV pilin N-terminal domain-containing protein [Halorhabdus amylolytica]